MFAGSCRLKTVTDECLVVNQALLSTLADFQLTACDSTMIAFCKVTQFVRISLDFSSYCYLTFLPALLLFVLCPVFSDVEAQPTGIC